MAYAAAKFAESCLYAMAGRPGVVECAYVQSAITDLPFFASQLRLGVNGIEVRLGLSFEIKPWLAQSDCNKLRQSQTMSMQRN
jgi:hypothetical protein